MVCWMNIVRWIQRGQRIQANTPRLIVSAPFHRNTYNPSLRCETKFCGDAQILEASLASAPSSVEFNCAGFHAKLKPRDFVTVRVGAHGPTLCRLDYVPPSGTRALRSLRRAYRTTDYDRLRAPFPFLSVPQALHYRGGRKPYVGLHVPS